MGREHLDAGDGSVSNPTSRDAGGEAKLSLRVTRAFRNQVRAAAALDGYPMDAWIYAILAPEVAKRLPDRAVASR